ncbi:MAG: hypothetical protein ACC726_02855 [Chloroflexota bacterium]
MRRGLGRGRTLIGIGSTVAIIGLPLPWLKVGGVVLSAQTASGFEGGGVLVFLASVAMLALIVLPFTTRSGRASFDRPVAYLGLLAMGLTGLGMAVLNLLGTEGVSLPPTDVPGIWLAGAGMVLVTWGVAELFAERSSSR